jgi:hypothetical protein
MAWMGHPMGRGGSASLPPLGQDVYDRLAILRLDLEAARPQRALMNIKARPELLPASDLLWRLRYLGVPVQPIVIFRLEPLAFSMGWAAQWALGLKSEEEILSEALLLAMFPEGMAGFLMALEFTPRITRLAVDR